jgi:predicted DNA-binding transcriptional regulator AlpA
MQTSSTDSSTRFLGPAYAGRQFLRYADIVALGIVNNRTTLNNWIAAGKFPEPIHLQSRTGSTLVWAADAVAAFLAAKSTINKPQGASRRDEARLCHFGGPEPPCPS